MSFNTASIMIRRAVSHDAPTVRAILLEANAWLEQRGARLWTDAEICAAAVARDIAEDATYLAECDGACAATLKLQSMDLEVWPELPQEEALYIHRFAVRRKFSGGALSNELLAWALERTRALGRPFLRLECEAQRLRLRAFYERFGFRFRDERQVGEFLLARYEMPAALISTK